MINIILITISTLNTFDMILPLTGGGPGRRPRCSRSIPTTSFSGSSTCSDGAVLAVIMLLISLVLTVAYRRLLRSEGACERPPAASGRIGDALTYLVFVVALRVLRRAAAVGAIALDPHPAGGLHHVAQPDPRDPDARELRRGADYRAVLRVPDQLASSSLWRGARRDAGRRPGGLRFSRAATSAATARC